MQEEIWKSCPVNDNYETSDLGRFRNKSTKKIKVVSYSKPIDPKRGKGYYSVNLYRNNKSKVYFIARLIWSTFNGPILDGSQINHKNGDKSDNRISNLEVVTPSENMRHAYANGLIKKRKGEKMHNSLLMNSQVREIRRKWKDGIRNMDLCSEFMVSKHVIFNIVHNINYRDI